MEKNFGSSPHHPISDHTNSPTNFRTTNHLYGTPGTSRYRVQKSSQNPGSVPLGDNSGGSNACRSAIRSSANFLPADGVSSFKMTEVPFYETNNISRPFSSGTADYPIAQDCRSSAQISGSSTLDPSGNSPMNVKGSSIYSVSGNTFSSNTPKIFQTAPNVYTGGSDFTVYPDTVIQDNRTPSKWGNNSSFVNHYLSEESPASNESFHPEYISSYPLSGSIPSSFSTPYQEKWDAVNIADSGISYSEYPSVGRSSEVYEYPSLITNYIDGGVPYRVYPMMDSTDPTTVHFPYSASSNSGVPENPTGSSIEFSKVTHSSTGALGFFRNPVNAYAKTSEDAIEKNSSDLTGSHYAEHRLPTEQATHLPEEENKLKSEKLAEGVIGREGVSTRLIRKTPFNLQSVKSNPVPKGQLMSKPIQLLHVNKWDGQEVLKVDEQAKEFLLKLGNKRVVVISICGDYGVGKSTLANCLMDNSENENGFNINEEFTSKDAIEGCNFKSRSPFLRGTDGVWLWGKEDVSKDTVFLILDFEGSGNVLKSMDRDRQLFSVASLVSTYLIYNTKGKLTDASFEKFLALCQSSNSGSSEFKSSNSAKRGGASVSHGGSPFNKWLEPKLLWILRDFSLILHDENQVPVTAEYYFQMRCKDHGVTESKRSTLDYVNESFSEYDCFTLASFKSEKGVSADSEKEMKLQWKEHVLPQVLQLQNKVFRETMALAAEGGSYTCVVFCKILERIVEIMNKNEIPNASAIWEILQQQEGQKYHDHFVNLFHENLRSSLESSLPVSESVIKQKCKELKKEILAKYNQEAIGDPDTLAEFRSKIKADISDVAISAMEENEELATRKSMEKMGILLQNFQIEQKITNNEYPSASAFNADIAAIFDQYDLKKLPHEEAHNAVSRKEYNRLICLRNSVLSANTEKLVTDLKTARQERDSIHKEFKTLQQEHKLLQQDFSICKKSLDDAEQLDQQADWRDLRLEDKRRVEQQRSNNDYQGSEIPVNKGEFSSSSRNPVAASHSHPAESELYRKKSNFNILRQRRYEGTHMASPTRGWRRQGRGEDGDGRSWSGGCSVA